ncbi:DNA polymerase Y family protein [Schaalia naturae]|uniref:DNA polymerase Y family protein n=1 Tax=Schaalia naturae TaxID=635203 RepID=A0ABW2SKA7_9ACTO
MDAERGGPGPHAPAGVRRVVLWVPDWPTTSLVVDVPPGAPAATVREARVVVPTMAARRAGVRARMPVSTAQSLCPGLIVLADDPVRQASAFEPVARVFDAVAAGVVCLRPGLAWAPAAGPARWLGTEEALAECLVESVAAQTGAECQVGIATGMLASLEAARQGVVVPPADTGEFLADLPLAGAGRVLPPEQAEGVLHAVDVLSQLGVRTCADAVGLGRGPLATRFGRAGEVLWSLCTGGDLPTRGMARAPRDVSVSLDHDPPVVDLDQVVVGLRRLAEELAGSLWRAGASSQTLTVWMETETGVRRERTWTAVDCASPADVVDRARWQLRGWSQACGSAEPGAQAPDSALARVGMVARGLVAAPPGPPLWGREDGRVRAERAVLRLQSLLGEEAVIAPHAQGGQDPRSRVSGGVWGAPVPDLAPLDGEWEGGVDGEPATVLDAPCPARLYGMTEKGPERGAPLLAVVASEGQTVTGDERRGREGLRPLHVGPRGDLDARPTVLVPDPAPGARLPAGLEAGRAVTIRVTGGPWAVLGRWWEGPDSPRAPRAYLRVGRENGEGPDLLLVQRQGSWAVEGVYD